MFDKFNFNKNIEPIYSDDFYYDLFQGGNIKPDEILCDVEQARKVIEAVIVIKNFLRQSEDEEIIIND